jgi:hypothetical protein
MKSSPLKKKPATGQISFQGITISHPDRIIDPPTGLTKGGLAEVNCYFDGRGGQAAQNSTGLTNSAARPLSFSLSDSASTSFFGLLAGNHQAHYDARTGHLGPEGDRAGWGG